MHNVSNDKTIEQEGGMWQTEKEPRMGLEKVNNEKTHHDRRNARDGFFWKPVLD